MGSTQQKWEQIVSQKRTARDQLLGPYLVDDIEQRVPRVFQVDQRSCLESEPHVQEITNIDNIVVLSQLLQKGKLTAESVISAYIKRAVVAHQLVPYFTLDLPFLLRARSH